MSNKIRNQDELPLAAKDQIENTSKYGAGYDSAVNGANIAEAVPFYNQAPCEIVYKSQNNSWIVLGRDRPGPKSSGYGGRGATQAGSIDLVVGRMGATKGGPKSNIYADPNFAGDSARIYISQKTDIDKNFGIVLGNVGLSEARSGIGIKADAVRIIAREGIKLVTGGSTRQERNSVNELLSGSPYGIDLIAGNEDEDDGALEPMVKGLRLAQALRDMNERIDELNGMYTTLLLALMVHGHPPYMVPSPSLLSQILGQCLIPAYGQKMKIMADGLNNYESFGGNWICSRQNRVN
jgi:hypothetical protein